MTELEMEHRLKLIRYGGLVLTVVVLIIVLSFTILTRTQAGDIAAAMGGDVNSATSTAINALIPFDIGFVILALVVAAVSFFGYRAYLVSKLKKN